MCGHRQQPQITFRSIVNAVDIIDTELSEVDLTRLGILQCESVNNHNRVLASHTAVRKSL